MTTSSLKQRIQEDMKTALKAKQQKRLNVIRLLQAAIKQREIDERISLDDNQVIAVIEKMIKQRRESISQYQRAKRQDLVDQETFEIEVLQMYLPPPLTAAQINELIEQALNETQANSIQALGKVMTYLKPHVQGRTDMKALSEMLKQRLTQ